MMVAASPLPPSHQALRRYRSDGELFHHHAITSSRHQRSPLVSVTVDQRSTVRHHVICLGRVGRRSLQDVSPGSVDGDAGSVHRQKPSLGLLAKRRPGW